MHPIPGWAADWSSSSWTRASESPGQLIFTTHESSLLDLDLLRRDEIWFAERITSRLHVLYYFGRFQGQETTWKIRKHYLQGRFGAIPFLGNLDRLVKGQDDIAWTLKPRPLLERDRDPSATIGCLSLPVKTRMLPGSISSSSKSRGYRFTWVPSGAGRSSPSHVLDRLLAIEHTDYDERWLLIDIDHRGTGSHIADLVADPERGSTPRGQCSDLQPMFRTLAASPSQIRRGPRRVRPLPSDREYPAPLDRGIITSGDFSLPHFTRLSVAGKPAGGLGVLTRLPLYSVPEHYAAASSSIVGVNCLREPHRINSHRSFRLIFALMAPTRRYRRSVWPWAGRPCRRMPSEIRACFAPPH